MEETKTTHIIVWYCSLIHHPYEAFIKVQELIKSYKDKDIHYIKGLDSCDKCIREFDNNEKFETQYLDITTKTGFDVTCDISYYPEDTPKIIVDKVIRPNTLTGELHTYKLKGY